MRCDSKSVATLLGGEVKCILVGSIPKIVHCEVEIERVVDWAKELFPVCGYQFEVVKIIEFFQKSRRGQGRFIIVDEPARAVRIEGFRNHIKQSLQGNKSWAWLWTAQDSPDPCFQRTHNW